MYMDMKRIALTLFASVMCLFAFAQSAADAPQIRLVRNATLLIDYNGKKILLDPMLSPKGAFGSWAGNGVTPSVDLPMPVSEIVDGVDFVLLTHGHDDHFDNAAIKAIDKEIPFFVQPENKQMLLDNNFWNTTAVGDSIIHDGITIIRTEAQHGTGRMLANMGAASGYVLKAENQPIIYVIGDAVWTQGIYDNILKYKPDYIVVNSGGAIMPPQEDWKATPIIMDERQTMALVQESGEIPVIAVHMDAIGHCMTTRDVLRKEARKFKVSPEKLIIPADGEIVRLNK